MALLRPDGDITVALSCSTGTSHYALVDETSLNIADYVYQSSGNGTTANSDLLSTGTFTKPGTISTVIGWFYLGASLGQNGGSCSFTIKLYKGATELATATTSSTGWQSITYTGDLTQSELDDLRLYVYISATAGQYDDGKGNITYYPSTGYCYMAYAVVNHAITAPLSEITAEVKAATIVGHADVAFPGEAFPITFPSPFGDAPFVATAALLVPTIDVSAVFVEVFIDAVLATANGQSYQASITGTCLVADVPLIDASTEIPTPAVGCSIEIIIPWPGTDFPGTFPIPLVRTNASFWHTHAPSLFIEVFLTVPPMEAAGAVIPPAILLAVRILAKINDIPISPIAKYKDIGPATVYKINDVAWL